MKKSRAIMAAFSLMIFVVVVAHAQGALSCQSSDAEGL